MVSSGPTPDRQVQALVADAELAFQRGEVDAGGRFLEEATTILLAQGEGEEAVQLCLALREHGRAARVAEQMQDHRRAAQLWLRISDYGAAARARLKNGEPLMAAELFERAGQLARAAEIYESERDFVRAAQLYHQAGEKRRAADLYVRAATGRGEHRLVSAAAAEACRRAGLLYAELGETELAAKVLSWAGQSVFAGKILAQAGKTDDAIQILSDAGDLLAAAQVARDAGDQRRAHLILARRAEQEGRYPEAAALTEEAGDFARAAQLYELCGALQKAASAYEHAGRFDSAAPLYERLGQIQQAVRCLRAAGRETEAVALADRAKSHEDSIRRAAMDGDFLRAATGAVAFARAGEPDKYLEAVSYLEQVSRSHADWLSAQTLLAEVLAERGDTQRAQAVLQRLFMGAKPTREHVPAMYQYGRLLELEGYLAGARNAYRTVVAFDPVYKDTSERLRLLGDSEGRGLSMAPAPEPEAKSRPIPTLPLVVGGPFDSERSPIPRGASSTMALIDQELQALSGEVSKDLIRSPSAPELPFGSGEVMAALEKAAPRTEDLLGIVLRGRFRIEKRIGKGAQATVYVARDQVLDREVAIKILSDSVAADQPALDRFLREARLAARVHHPGCIAIYDFGHENGVTFMAMEYFRGRTLRELVKRGALDPYLALRLARDIASALAAVHQAGIIHRDVKPANVMVDRAGNIRLTDFGVARGVGDEPTGNGMMVGTMKYMAPEQARGRDTDRRADIFSLGVVLYEMLAGQPPFGGTLDALIARVTKAAPDLPETLEVPPLVRQLVARCLQKKPAQRYGAAEELIEELTRALALLKEERKRKPSEDLIAEPRRPAPRSGSGVEPVPA